MSDKTYTKYSADSFIGNAERRKVLKINQLDRDLSNMIKTRNNLVDDHELLTKTSDVYIDVTIRKELKADNSITYIRHLLITGLETKIANIEDDITGLSRELKNML